jgi:chemotaxis signal transduction protein
MTHILTFRSAGRSWAVPLASVHEVVSVESVTHLPLTPLALAGVVDVHGSAVPAVDFAKLAGDGGACGHSAIVLDCAKSVAAILVDEVRDVVNAADIEYPEERRFTWAEGIAGDAVVIDPVTLLEAIE